MSTVLDLLSGRMDRDSEPISTRASEVAADSGATDGLLPPPISGAGDDEYDFDTSGIDDDDYEDEELDGDFEEIDELLGEEYDDDDEDLLDGEDDFEFVTLGARREARQKRLRTKLARLKRKRQRYKDHIATANRNRRPGWKHKIKVNERRIDRINPKIKEIEKQLGIAKKKKTVRKAKEKAVKRKDLGYSKGTALVELDPAGGTPANIPFLPEAAPVGPDWTGAVATPMLTATIPAGLQTADIALATRALSYMIWQLVNIRVKITSASSLFGAIGRNLTTDGSQSFFPDTTSYTDLQPWDVETDTPLPSLRGQPVEVESPNTAQMTLAARGAAADVGLVSVNAMAQIIKDQSSPTKGAYHPRPKYPVAYGPR